MKMYMMSLMYLSKLADHPRSVVFSPSPIEGRSTLVPMMHVHALDRKAGKTSSQSFKLIGGGGVSKAELQQRKGVLQYHFWGSGSYCRGISRYLPRKLHFEVWSQPSYPGFICWSGLLVEKGVSLWLVPIPLYNISHERGGDFVQCVAMAWEEVSFLSLDNIMHA